MSWKDQLNKAVARIKKTAESLQAQDIPAKAKAGASNLVHKARAGAVSAADALVKANRDPSSMTIRYLKAHVSVLSPSEGISISRPDATSLVIADNKENSLVINAAAEPPVVSEMIGTVSQLDDNTYDLGGEEGINVVVIKT